MRCISLMLCAIAASIWFAALPAPASAQTYVNPYRPVPMQRYPVCDSLQTRSGGANCTANPDLAHSRANCGWNCPEDVPDLYARMGEGTLNLFCGDPDGRGCVGAYFTRDYEPRLQQCIYRVVADDAAVHPVERPYVIPVSQLRHQGRIDLIRPDHGAHPRFGRRYDRQMRDVLQQQEPPPAGHYRIWQPVCRH